MVGTAIVRFSRSADSSVPAVLPIMSLDPQRRHAARTRIGVNTLREAFDLGLPR